MDRYQEEFHNHTATRHENDRLLLARLQEIESGQAIDALEPFAKAYLGMYLDIDNSVTPEKRINILANETLASAVIKGLHAALQNTQLPDSTEIADSMIDENPLALGYIILAGIILLARQDINAVLTLPAQTLQAATCFHFANKTEIQKDWFDILLANQQQLAARTLHTFWSRLIERGSAYLPGLYQIISHQQYDAISNEIILPVLANWHQCNKATLRDVLHTALRVADHGQLLPVCENALQTWNRAEPGRYMLWLTTAFLLSPDRYDMVLTDYAGRSKEKILPLLDFVVMVLLTDDGKRLPLTADAFAQLLRIIAPKFTPQEDRYGNLCDNTQKVLYLFYRLATTGDVTGEAAIRRLDLIRVMKLYRDILQFTLSTHKQMTLSGKVPEFEVFVGKLLAENRIKSRKKWSDRGDATD